MWNSDGATPSWCSQHRGARISSMTYKRMHGTVLQALTLVALSVVTLAPALAVTDGRLDGQGHPAVVLLLMEVGGKPAYRCTGTLLSATVLLTAGHCTNNFPGSPYTGMRVFTESDVQAGIGTTNNYPF